MLILDLEKRDYEKVEEEKEKLGVLEVALHYHLNVLKSYEEEPYSKKNDIFIGTCPFNSPYLPGTHRVTIAFRSPLTGTFFSSTSGGGGYWIMRTGERIFWIKGKSDIPLIIGINDEKALFFEIEKEKLFEIFRGYKEEKGNKALALFSLEFLKEHLGGGYRVFCIGPAAFSTDFGNVFSCMVTERGILYEDFCGRGGAGSLLAYKGLAAIAFGGKEENYKAKLGIDAVKKVFSTHGMEYPKAILDATEKYREKGTFGGNYPKLQHWTIRENWRMIYENKEKREEVFRERIMDTEWYVKFKENVLDKKSSRTCGEPCIATCKKYWDTYKIDYEPYQALGLNCGIYLLKDARELVELVDKLGFDAIEMGHIVAFFLELDEKGEVKIDGETRLEKAINVVNQFYEKNWKNKNLRTISREMGLQDYAVYIPIGERWCICPTFYWCIGVLLPLPLPGKWCTVYEVGHFKEPEEFAKEVFNAGVKEITYDNFGICRFQRKWIDGIIDDLYFEAYGERINHLEIGKNLLKKFWEYNEKAGATPVFWESKRVLDIIRKLAEEIGTPEWKEKMKEDKGIKEYFDRFFSEYKSLLGV